MINLKELTKAIGQVAEEKGLPPEKVLETVEAAIAAAYKRDYGERGQIVRAHFDSETGTVSFEQIKIAVDESMLRPVEQLRDSTGLRKEGEKIPEEVKEGEEPKIFFNPERHIMIEEARKIKKDD